jgi:hypothetical protein
MKLEYSYESYKSGILFSLEMLVAVTGIAQKAL